MLGFFKDQFLHQHRSAKALQAAVTQYSRLDLKVTILCSLSETLNAFPSGEPVELKAAAFCVPMIDS